MKKIICLVIVSFFFGITITHALELNIEKEIVPNYDYSVNGTRYNLELYTDKKTNRPMFKIDVDKDYYDGLNYRSKKEKYPYEELLFNASFHTTNGKTASLDNLKRRIAMQLYFYELDAKRKNLDFKLEFVDPEIKEITNELLNEAHESINEVHYNYESKVNEWIVLSDFPWNNYCTFPNIPDLEFNYEHEETYLLPLKEQDYSFKVAVWNNEAYYSYYINDDTSRPDFLIVTNPQRQLPIINIHVPKTTYQIITSEDKTLKINVLKEASKGSEVTFSIDILPGYLLDEIKVIDEFANEIPLNNNTFVMPDSNVKIFATTKKERKKVTIEDIEGLKFNNLQTSYSINEKVTLDYTLIDGYKLDSLEIKTENNEPVSIIDNTFIMPNANIIITASTLKEHELNLLTTKGIFVKTKSLAYPNEEIKLDIKTLENYELTTIDVQTTSGKKITLNNNSFIMPNEDVTIVLKAKYNEKEEYTYYEDIPNTYEKDYKKLLIIPIILSLVIKNVKAKKYY